MFLPLIVITPKFFPLIVVLPAYNKYLWRLIIKLLGLWITPNPNVSPLQILVHCVS